MKPSSRARALNKNLPNILLIPGVYASITAIMQSSWIGVAIFGIVMTLWAAIYMQAQLGHNEDASLKKEIDALKSKVSKIQLSAGFRGDSR